MKKNQTKFQQKAIETAYCWTRYKYYGSEAKAVKSLLNRKGLEGFSKDEALASINLSIDILKETEILAKLERKAKGKRFDRFTEDEINDFSNKLKNELVTKFPTVNKKVFDYAVGMIVLMPYYR